MSVCLSGQREYNPSLPLQHLPTLPIVPAAYNCKINLKQPQQQPSSSIMIFCSTSNSELTLFDSAESYLDNCAVSLKQQSDPKPPAGRSPTTGAKTSASAPPNHNVNSDRDMTKASFSNSTCFFMLSPVDKSHKFANFYLLSLYLQIFKSRCHKLDVQPSADLIL